MSVLHPVGPEEPQTYWIRRALVVAAVLVVLGIIIALVVNAASSGTAVQANPSRSASPIVVPTPTPSVVTASTAVPSSTDSATATTSSTPTAKSTATKKASSKPTPTATKKPVLATCDPSDIRVTLTGDRRLKTKKPNKFALSVINGSDSTCLANVTGKNFQVKIYSGKDRIWSTKDCSTAIKTVDSKLKTQQAVAWTQTWNGRRSRDDCKNRPETPKAGTYIVTAKLDGAKAVEMRMILV